MATVPAQVLLATWNGERYLEEQVRSILGQEHRDLRLLVRDDGSTDGTVPLLQALAAGDDRMVVLPSDGERLGPADSFIRLLGAAPAGAPAYLFADQDDRWLPHKVARSVAALSGRVGPTLYACRIRFCDGELANGVDGPIVRRPGLGNALVQNLFPGCSTAIDGAGRDLLLGATPPPGIHLDHWVYLLMTVCGEIVVDDEIGIWNRRHGTNATVAPWPPPSVRDRLWRMWREGADRVIARSADALLDRPDLLSGRDRSLVEWVLRDRPTARSRARLAISRRIWRDQRREDLAFRVRVLLVGA